VNRSDKPLRRRYGDRAERQRFLIYCEGSVTEDRYFKELRRELRAATVEIKLGRCHGEPYRLVEEAIEHQRCAPQRADDRYESYDQDWCVFDVEAPQPHPRLAEATRLADRHGIRCATSNPCFELWLFLHFQPHNRYVTTDAMCRLLEGCRCGYGRDSKRFDFAMLQQRRPMAHEHARQLHERHGSTPDIVNRNSWTSVDTLVDELFRNTST
jgi:hypothetical protein